MSAGGRLAFIFVRTAAASPIGVSSPPARTGRRRIAVNLRLAEPDTVGAIVVDHFDGLVSFDDLGRDGRCVAVMWF
jgi:hypothetical protein